MRGVYVKMTPFQLPISNNNEQLLGPPMPKIVPNFHPSLFHRLGGESRFPKERIRSHRWTFFPIHLTFSCFLADIDSILIAFASRILECPLEKIQSTFE